MMCDIEYVDRSMS